jgi:hypothetical protein
MKITWKRFLNCFRMKRVQSLIPVAVLLAFAQNAVAQSISEISNNLLGPTVGMAKFMSGVSIVAGIGFLIGSLMQYSEHKKNPQQIRLTTPVLFFILGLLLVGLPYASKLSGSFLYLQHAMS